MIRHFRLCTYISALLMCALFPACSSTVSVSNMSVLQAPPAATTKVAVSVDKTKNNDQGEAVALENGLIREFKNAGYELAASGLSVQAEITEISRGSTVANVLIGMGAGADRADVAVRVSDAAGKQLIAFVVRGKVVDKKYRELSGVLNAYVSQAIVSEIKKASR